MHELAIVLAIVLGAAADVDTSNHTNTNIARQLQTAQQLLPSPPPAPCTSPFPLDFNYEACLGWCINNPENKCASAFPSPRVNLATHKLCLRLCACVAYVQLPALQMPRVCVLPRAAVSTLAAAAIATAGPTRLAAGPAIAAAAAVAAAASAVPERVPARLAI